MDVLVIGGTRFLGYQTVWRLLTARHHVTLLNRGKIPETFGDRVERLLADRTSPEFNEVLRGRSFDAVIDFAAYTGADARGVVDVLNGRVGHYVFISSGQVYLVRQQVPQPAVESDYDGAVMPHPPSADDDYDWRYGLDKREAEDTLTAAWQSRSFPSTRLRIPMVNGERDYQRRIESYLWRILDGGPIILPDGGLHKVRPVYSGSVARTITAILGNSSTFGEAYNLAQSETPTLRALVELLAELLGASPEIMSVSSSQLEIAGIQPQSISPFSGRWMSFLDPGKAIRELDFRHESLDRYLGQIVAWFLNCMAPTPPENYGFRSVELALAS